VLGSEKKLETPCWQPQPSSVDVVVADAAGGWSLAFELKWCWKKKELGWTLWDSPTSAVKRLQTCAGRSGRKCAHVTFGLRMVEPVEALGRGAQRRRN
jgi:hypothetical protein